LWELWRAWPIQKRVLGALFMREIQVRWGRRNLGFAWVFAEPLVFAFPVLVMWSFVRGPVERDVPMIPFIWTGYMGILMFRHVTGSAVYVVRHNAHILYHHAITPLDIFIGHCGLEMMGSLAATVFSFIVLYMLGFVKWPENPSLMIAGNLYMGWWSLAMALIIGALSERTEIVEHVWPPISYMYLPVSGFFYLAEWLPAPLRSLALHAMPALPCYEMIRAGLFGSHIQTFYDPVYLSGVLSVLTFIGLWLMRDVRRFIELD
jgi:capsular polysaccharide transport system permease protein